MTSKLLEKIGHNKCGSSDALAVYEDDKGRISGHCFSCGEHVNNPYEGSPVKTISTNNKKTASNSPTVLDIYNNCPIQALPDRGIRLETCEYFGVRVGLSPRDRSIAHHYYPRTRGNTLVSYKDRVVALKKFYNIGESDDLDLFGQLQALAAGGKKIFITEGEMDTLAAWQMLVDEAAGTKWADYKPAVMSLLNGASGAANDFAKLLKVLPAFEEIVLVFDMDEPGQKAAKVVAGVLSQFKVTIAQLPMKDANEMLLANQSKAFKKAVLFTAKPFKPSGMMSVKDIYESARQRVTMGLPWPWPSLTRLTYGRYRGQLVGVAAGTGVGKTAIWHQLIDQIVYKDKLKVGIFMLEEGNNKTIRSIASRFSSHDFNSPESNHTQEELDTALNNLEGKVFLYSHREDKTWESIREQIRYLVLAEGIKDIIIDPIGQMVDDYESSVKNDKLNSIFKDIASMAESLDFTFYYSSHLNAPDSGKPHEEGGRVRAIQLTGSKAMIKASHLIIGVERNTQAEEIEERNTVTLRVLKDRENGRTGWFTANYNPADRTLLEDNT